MFARFLAMLAPAVAVPKQPLTLPQAMKAASSISFVVLALNPKAFATLTPISSIFSVAVTTSV